MFAVGHITLTEAYTETHAGKAAQGGFYRHGYVDKKECPRKSEIRLEENSHGKESSRSRTTAKLTSREMWNENDHFKTLVTIWIQVGMMKGDQWDCLERSVV